MWEIGLLVGKYKVHWAYKGIAKKAGISGREAKLGLNLQTQNAWKVQKEHRLPLS